MERIIKVKDQFYILATSSLSDERTQVLKHGETFAIFDRHGDIEPTGSSRQGLFHEGTRFVSGLSLTLDNDRPLLLSSSVNKENVLLAVDLTNPDYSINEQVLVSRGVLHLFRSKFLWQGVCYERIRIGNYGLLPVDVSLALQFYADFADIFEVRGQKRKQRGRRLRDVVEERSVLLSYEGLDHVVRRTRLEFSVRPKEISNHHIRYETKLRPKGEETLFVTVSCEIDRDVPPRMTFDTAFTAAMGSLRSAKAQDCTVHSSNEQFNDWVHSSMADLHMMVTETPQGPYPYAGVPWFNTAFGRDGLITALECLWINPAIAQGVLAFLAATQARQVIPEQDAEPGKIMHEARKGEMAQLKEIPFGRYYGSVDSTPLFVLLASAFYERTGNRLFIESIWPNIELALKWMDEYGDMDGDGFVEYIQRSPKGLSQQGWKDSHDSVFHSDGTIPEGPIALCEVQGYVYAAKRGAAQLAAALGEADRARELARQADELRERFEQVFWCEELGTYALALDGRKRRCLVRTSNAGHVLFSGIANAEHAAKTAQTLLGPDSFSGWGIRTVSSSEVRYNPMAYHNGSVWPHDNAMIGSGLIRYGYKESAVKIMTGLFDASFYMNLHRLPELFCGFKHRNGEGPTLYPVACSPQAWASGAVLMMLQSCLGLSVDAPNSRISFSHPLLPDFLQYVRITNLRVGEAAVDLLLNRYANDVSVNVLRREGHVEIVVIK
ncbi:MAG: amylo-alpha-1,6-glucosidase [Elusimicrobia bacterium]|nr:amylo-alpha-1,6-glucosidase [Elusimicrobiota bacterium]